MKKTNIVLIGMPSSGKSTTGRALSRALGKGFTDTDVLILNRAGKPLKNIVNEDGLSRFLEIQEKVILDMSVEDQVIATGGGAVYSAAAMEHLGRYAVVIYLKLTFDEIERRVAPERRFARANGQDLYDLYNERVPLYEKYADITVDCSQKSIDEIVNTIIKSVENSI